MTNVNGTLNFLASAGPHANTTVGPDELDEIMKATGGSIIGCGSLYEIVTKRLSPKVYKLTLKRFAL